MKTITNAVRQYMKDDETAREAARRGILNHSAYAEEILPQIAKETWKDVEKTSVGVSISRISQEKKWPPIKPEIQLNKVVVETGLVDVTFERSSELQRACNFVIPEIRRKLPHDLYIESTGQSQVTMIMTKKMWTVLAERLAYQPIGYFENLVAISVSFDKKYLEVPNFIYSVLSIFALQNINLMEIVSTMTEIILVIDNHDMELAISGLKKYLK